MEDRRAHGAKGLTAAIIIIGDEILKGHVQDTNSHFLCKELWALGVKVCRTVVVADDIQAIAAEVEVLSPLYDFILTSGGVGPTHDDITMEAVGRAFSEELAPHPTILRFLFPNDPESPSHLTNPWRKMALVPTSTQVHVRAPNENDIAFSFLLMVVHNVHCYPGVPSLLKDIFLKCKDLYGGGGVSFYLKEVFFSCLEDVLANPLTNIQRQFPQVQVGSYPSVSASNNYSVKVTLESKDKELVEEAYSKLTLALPVSVMISSKDSYDQSDGTVSDRREHLVSTLGLSAARVSLLPSSLCSRIHNSIQTLEKALERYSLTGMCVAFNGGKDCTVIVALLRALLNRCGCARDTSKIKILYVVESQQFPEVENFFQSAVEEYGLEVIQLSGGIRHALSVLKDSHPELKAVCMGTRHTDPHSAGLEAFSPTDSSWPEYMRVNSILEWSYGDIWLFLRLCGIPYCKLYDEGYTSLDGVADTHPNPSLLIVTSPDTTSSSSDHTPRYLPAFMLEDETLERNGRTTKASL